MIRCESESGGPQVGRELGTREVGWEHDIVGEYACNGARVRVEKGHVTK